MHLTVVRKTKILIKKLREIDKKEKEIMRKKRKTVLRQETETKIKELTASEELDIKGASNQEKEKACKKKEQSKITKDKCKDKDERRDKCKDNVKGTVRSKGKDTQRKDVVQDSEEPGTFVIVSDSIVKYMSLDNDEGEKRKGKRYQRCKDRDEKTVLHA
ncbi:unnamed protein product [Mytilus coruscus]|uniref:Uncharacterized protein n=1 Tax=Mytilus coruscus TaxID=42192 RepID=A0A6J8CAV8_MYTCO|nr:unnamed protein product [Mytilus coruscus]